MLCDCFSDALLGQNYTLYLSDVKKHINNLL